MKKKEINRHLRAVACTYWAFNKRWSFFFGFPLSLPSSHCPSEAGLSTCEARFKWEALPLLSRSYGATIREQPQRTQAIPQCVVSALFLAAGGLAGRSTLAERIRKEGAFQRSGAR